MPKIRGVKPDYWTDEDIVDLTIPARLLFIGLWNYACDNGHLQDKPKQIKMRIFPGDDINCTELLRELETKGRITRGAGWITVPNLTEHQKPDLRYFTTCDKEDCQDPPEKVSQRAARRAHGVRTSGAQGAHDGRTVGALGDGEGDGEVKVTTAAAGSEEFDEWWAAYPKKRDKGHAVKAYRSARKKVDAETLLVAIKQQAPHLMKNGVEFCPFAATWLNGDRWEDEAPQLTVVAENDWMRRRPKQ